MLVNTRSRNINLEKVTGDIKVVNNHGDVDINVAPPTGTVTVDNQNGNVNVTLPEKAKFTLNAETSDGDTHSDFLDNDTHGGHGTLSGSVNGGGPTVRLNTSHGDVNVSRNNSGPLPPVPLPPRISGLGDVPAPPPPPDWTGARQTVADAQKMAQDAMREADAELQEAQKKRQEALRMAREAAKTKQPQ